MSRKSADHILLCSSLAAIAFSLTSTTAHAQQAYDDSGLGVIVVTAQKRAQNIQDVPIAVTALDGSVLQSNRVTNVNDLSGLAPGVTVRPAAGGSLIPSFSIRGAVSYGVVPGSDKQVSVYIDGVYIGSPNGSTFDLPDVQRIEVLRGPQGTLFGRNANAGAISVTTRDPSGDAQVKASTSFGNRDLRRFQLTADTPQMGPFSGYFSYVHEKRHGDIRNLAEGTLWNRQAALIDRAAGYTRSPKYLGSKDSDAYFAALKFETGDFTTVYKFDYYRDNGTPEGNAFLGYDRATPLIGNLLTALFNSQTNPIPLNPSNLRPDAVSNGFSVPRQQTVEGHSLTSTYQISDSLSIKNIFAHRKVFVFVPSALDAFSPLTLTSQAIGPYATFVAFSTVPGLGSASPEVQQATIQAIAAQLAPAVGQPFVAVASQPTSQNEQTSDELQLNYESGFLTATVGGIWFKTKQVASAHRLNNTIQYAPVFGHILTNNRIGETTSRGTSWAGYGQLEFHLTPQIDIVLGGRLTHDKKTGYLITGANLTNLRTIVSPKYSATKLTYLAGVNYKPNEDVLLYAKYSTGYVSGGNVAGVPFVPETVKSAEGGVKAELLDRRLRANLALYYARYGNYQTAQSATNFTNYINTVTGDPTRAAVLATIVVPYGNIKAKGAELEVTAAPVRGLMVGGNLGYAKYSASNVNQAVLASTGGIYLVNQFRPNWTGGLFAQYDTPPLIGDANISARVDGLFQGKVPVAANPTLPVYQNMSPNAVRTPAYWLINGRIALQNVDLGGVSAQIALWGKNLTDRKHPAFNLLLGNIATGNYIPARSYGVDLGIEF